MKALRAFAHFWYDFLIGDDWKIAAAIVTALVVLYAVMAGAGLGDAALAVTGGALVVAAFTVSLVIDTRQRGR